MAHAPTVTLSLNPRDRNHRWNAHKEEELAKAQQKEKADAKWWAAHKNDKKWSKGAGEEA